MSAASRKFLPVVALAGFLLLAIGWTWPLASHLSSRVAPDAGDPLLNTWILWWNAHAVPFTERWWSPPIFDPMSDALALSEHLLGIALITTPLQAAGLSALTSYNVALILSFALSGLFAFLLGRRVTGSTAAGLCAGLAYGFSPYRAGQLSHLQVLTSEWMPLALFSMHAYVEDGRARWLALFAAAWVIQGWSNGYYLLFFPALLVLWLAWFVEWRREGRRGLALIATWVASSALLLPALLKYGAVLGRLGLSRTPDDVIQFSATPASFLHAPPMAALWPAVDTPITELYLFPGITAVALVASAGVASAIRRRTVVARRSPLAFYACATLVMAAFALGPAPPGSGVAALVHPYSLLTWLPGFDGLRVPARFAMLMVLCLSTAAGVAADRVAPRRRLAKWTVIGIVLAGLAADGWPRPMPLAPVPEPIALPEVANAAVLELPVDEGLAGTAAMYRAMTHRRPLVTGYSGYAPPHYFILSHALRRRDPSGITEMARGRPLIVVVNEAFDQNGDMRRLVEGVPGIQPRGRAAIGSLFLLPALPVARTPDPGAPVDVASIRELPREHAVIDLGATHTIRTIAFSIGHMFRDLGERFAVEASDDGESWRTVWEDWTGGPAIAAALRNPRTVPIQLTLPDIRARYLRVHPAPRWLLDALTVHAPR